MQTEMCFLDSDCVKAAHEVGEDPFWWNGVSIETARDYAGYWRGYVREYGPWGVPAIQDWLLKAKRRGVSEGRMRVRWAVAKKAMKHVLGMNDGDVAHVKKWLVERGAMPSGRRVSL